MCTKHYFSAFIHGNCLHRCCNMALLSLSTSRQQQRYLTALTDLQ